MSSRWTRILALCNALSGAILLVNVLSHVLALQQGHVPGTDWGMTQDRWKYILLQQSMVGCGLILFALLAWFRPEIARISDLFLTVPKLYYGFGFILWSRLSGNTVLQLAAMFMLAAVLLQPVFWIRRRSSAGAAAA